MLHAWALEHLPPSLTAPFVGGLAWWQILLIPIVFLTAYVLGRLFSALFTRISLRLTQLTSAHWDDLLAEAMRRPIRLLATGLFGMALLSLLDMQGRAHDVVFE